MNSHAENRIVRLYWFKNVLNAQLDVCEKLTNVLRKLRERFDFRNWIEKGFTHFRSTPLGKLYVVRRDRSTVFKANRYRVTSYRGCFAFFLHVSVSTLVSDICKRLWKCVPMVWYSQLGINSTLDEWHYHYCCVASFCVESPYDAPPPGPAAQPSPSPILALAPKQIFVPTPKPEAGATLRTDLGKLPTVFSCCVRISLLGCICCPANAFFSVFTQF